MDEAGVWVDCIRTRRAVIHNDYAALPHRKGLPPGHAMVVRELVVPVQRGDLIMAILGVGNKPSDYTAEDTNTVAALADFVWDIVAGKRAGEALRESEERLRIVIPSNLDGMIVVDQAGLIRMGNPAAEALLRRPLAELIGHPFGVPIADTATKIDMTHADGQIGTLDMRVSTMAWMGNPAFLVALRDTTERKRMQERLRHQATTDELTGGLEPPTLSGTGRPGDEARGASAASAVAGPDRSRSFQADQRYVRPCSGRSNIDCLDAGVPEAHPRDRCLRPVWGRRVCVVAARDGP